MKKATRVISEGGSQSQLLRPAYYRGPPKTALLSVRLWL
jgi:hypothetical protein